MKTGEFHYLAASVGSSLFRDDKVFTRLDGNDAIWQRADLGSRPMPVRDARSLERAKRPALDVNGFEIVEKSLRRAEIGCLDGREAVRHSNPQYGGGNREVTGAHHVAALNHNVRSVTDNAPGTDSRFSRHFTWSTGITR